MGEWQLKAEGALEENCRHRPVQYLNNVLEQDHRAIKRRVRASQHFRSLGRLAHNCRLRGDPYDPQRPSAVDCEGRSTAPLHSRAVRVDELNRRSSIIHADFRLDYKLATLPKRWAACS
jgi:hypothetical protein